jgi:hypothetical protein
VRFPKERHVWFPWSVRSLRVLMRPVSSLIPEVHSTFTYGPPICEDGCSPSDMPPVRHGPKDLLEYDATYGVIICRECQYAIQKSALQSHLLRHKIFRHERHSLLSLISRLEILEPDDVPLPPPSTKPIEALPVISGLRCVVGQCESLFASSKRMRRHQLECHDLAGPETDGANSMVRPVSLQTFFRGTKIRYFEVAGTATNVALKSPPSVEAVNTIEIGHPSQVSDVAATPTALAPVIDLHHLGYFHHFLQDTSLSLPEVDPDNPLYWHHEFVAQALQQEWLMAGLLAVAASHKATIAHATSTATAHHERSLILFQTYQKGVQAHVERQKKTCAWSTDSLEAVTTPHLTMPQGKPTPRHEVLDQLTEILSCAHVLFLHKTTQSGNLEALTTPIRGLIPKDSIGKHNAELMEISQADRDPSLSCLLDRISSLPTRMVEPLGRSHGPEDLQPATVALSAIARLIDSCAAGFDSDELTFSAMATWLSGAAGPFHELLAHNNAAALIVLAHWAGSLVRRVEENGCWFLKGAADFLLTRIRERLPQNAAVLELIEGL